MADITTLQQSLINAKKVMGKVDSGNFTKGHQMVQTNSITEGNLPPVQPLPQIPQIDDKARQDLSPKKGLTEEKIKNSKLPDAIKQAMIDNPIPEIPFNGGVGLSNEFVANVKEQMEKQNIPTSSSIPTPSQSTQTTGRTKKITSSNLKSIIKESVKELLDETIGLKTESDENFQFRVGDRIFYGKITSSKSVK